MMAHRSHSGLRITAFLLLAVVVCGCAGRPLTSARAPASLEALDRGIAETDRIVATTQIELMTIQGRFPVRAALLLQKPAYLRLEILPVIGTPDLFLALRPGNLCVYIPSRRMFYQGKPSAENMERFLSWALDVEDLIMILSGSYPRFSGETIAYESDAEGDLLRVDMATVSAGSGTVWMDKNGRIARLTRYGFDGKERYQVSYEDYEPGMPVAGKITIQMADQVTSVSVKFTNISIEKSTDLSIFEIPVPPGVKTIDLD